MKIIEQIEKQRHSIIITLPSSEKWDTYKNELKKVENYSNVMNFKVPNFPKGIKKGDKCYVVHNGYIKGWMEIIGFSEETFTCNTTNKEWSGKFIKRSGPFHYLSEKIPMKGFRGFRYFDLDEYKINNNIE